MRKDNLTNDTNNNLWFLFGIWINSYIHKGLLEFRQYTLMTFSRGECPIGEIREPRFYRCVVVFQWNFIMKE